MSITPLPAAWTRPDGASAGAPVVVVIGAGLDAASAAALRTAVEAAVHGWSPEPAGLRAVPDAPAGLDALTAREREVLLLLADGLSNTEVARELFLSEATVKSHVARVLTKLGVRDRVQAVVAAFRAWIVLPRGR
jgi:DNA-binding NarL/FixJ family response regulator